MRKDKTNPLGFPPQRKPVPVTLPPAPIDVNASLRNICVLIGALQSEMAVAKADINYLLSYVAHVSKEPKQ